MIDTKDAKQTGAAAIMTEKKAVNEEEKKEVQQEEEKKDIENPEENIPDKRPSGGTLKYLTMFS